MVFPVIATTSSGNNSSGGTSHAMTFPASVAAGDLLIAILELGNTPITTTWPSGWTQLIAHAAVTYSCDIRYRFYQAGDTAPTVTTNTTTISSYRVLRFTGMDAVTAPEAAALVTGSSANPNPGSLDPANWAAEDTLWVAVTTYAGTSAPTVYPTNYTGGTSSGNAFGGRIAYATRNLNATSDDPSTFTITSGQWSATTLAIRPVAAAQGAAVLAADTSLVAGGAVPAIAATLGATSTLSSAGDRQTSGAATLSGWSSLSAAGATPAIAAALNAITSLSAAGLRQTFGAATLVAQASLVSDATTGLQTTFVASSTLSAASLRQTFGAATLLASSTLLPAGATPAIAAVLLASSTLTAPGVREAPAISLLASSAILTALGATPAIAATLPATSALSTTGRLLPAVALATLAAGSQLVIAGYAILPVSAVLAADTALGGTLYTTWPSAVLMRAAGALNPQAGLPSASALLSASAQLTITGYLAGGADLVVLEARSLLTADARAFTPLLILPAGLVRRSTRVPTYRLYAADTRTGRIGWELPMTEMSWNTPINSAGSLRATLVIEDALDRLNDQGALDPRNTLREVLNGPYRFSLVVAWGNAVVFAGPYLPSTIPGDTPTVDIGAGELVRMFDKRVLVDRGDTLALGPMSYGGLIKSIIDSATSGITWWRLGRELPITCSNPPDFAGSLTREFPGYDMTTAAEALSGITDEDGAPDFRLDPYLVTGSDGLYVKWELRIGSPFLGAHIDPWVFDDTKALVSQDIDASHMASMLYVPGSGQDEEKLIAWWVDNELVDQGFPALEEVDTSRSSEVSIDVLDSYANAALRQYKYPVSEWSLKTQADGDPPLGSYRVGDPMLVDIRRHPVILPGTYIRRITEISGDATSWVTLTSTEGI